jgi:hypothetical protein
MDDIEAWREVHKHLITAITLTKESINAEKAKRRFLLEELYCHLSPDGTSSWVKTETPSKKAITRKRKSTSSGASDANTQSASSSKKKSKSVPAKKRQKTGKGDVIDDTNVTENDNNHSMVFDDSQHPQHLHPQSSSPIIQTNIKSEEVQERTIVQHEEVNINESQNISTQSNEPPSSLSNYSPKNQQVLNDNDDDNDDNDAQPANNFFNTVPYNGLDASAIDAAAAVASALTAQSYSETPSNNPIFEDSPFQCNQTSNNSFSQYSYQNLYQEDEDEEEDDF